MTLDRRSFLLGTGLTALGLVGCAKKATPESSGATGGTTTAASIPADENPRSCRPSDSLKALKDGNARFAAAWEKKNSANTPQERAQVMSNLWLDNCFLPASVLSEGQAPWATVLTCADSRLAPEWIFDAAPSDLFVIRSAGNTAFDDAIASMEFGVLALKTPLIMVMGHSACGAVKAAQGDELPTPLLTELVKPIRAAIQPGQDVETATKANASYAAKQLTARSEVIKDAVDNGTLQIVVGYFDIGSGKVTIV
ncbi:carbonic anhydrase [Synechococcus sp. BS55D]|uniref:carbonic anhydrase n=1 Tax=Synechococcus sp. BS55D TaxID=2055943 RepID=UPI001038B08B|nr:carbonic anhydrase [Synechococcus sp. BS55D]TCD57939.1 carbonic anhydrase [Synechococcus sp. BS55D]